MWDNDPDCWYSPSQGASTWVNPASGTSGLISTSNSLTGVGVGTVTVLTNSNYLVSGYNSLTWNSGTGGKTRAVSSANSLVGSPFDVSIGNKVIALSNGNYVTWSVVWDNGSTQDAGAVTWGNGATGTSGVVSIANSLVGTRVDDNVSNAGNWPGVVALANGNYVVISYLWDSPTTPNVGAVTWGSGTTGTSGLISSSVPGLAANQGSSMAFQAVAGDQRLVIGRDLSNIVTIVELLPRLIVEKSATGSDSVTSNPAGINCGADCTESYTANTLVTLTAAPAAGSVFAGWSGGVQRGRVVPGHHGQRQKRHSLLSDRGRD